MSKDVREVLKEIPFAIQVYDEIPEKFVPYKGAVNLICDAGKKEIVSYDGRGISDLPSDLPALRELIKEKKKEGMNIEETFTALVGEFYDFIDTNYGKNYKCRGDNPFNIFRKEDENKTVTLFVPEAETGKFINKNSKIMPPLLRKADKALPEQGVGAVQLASDYDGQPEFREEIISPGNRKVVDWEVRHAGTATVYTPVYEKD